MVILQTKAYYRELNCSLKSPRSWSPKLFLFKSPRSWSHKSYSRVQTVPSSPQDRQKLRVAPFLIMPPTLPWVTGSSTEFNCFCFMDYKKASVTSCSLGAARHLLSSWDSVWPPHSPSFRTNSVWSLNTGKVVSTGDAFQYWWWPMAGLKHQITKTTGR